jgi:hypothetical protein
VTLSFSFISNWMKAEPVIQIAIDYSTAVGRFKTQHNPSNCFCFHHRSPPHPINQNNFR